MAHELGHNLGMSHDFDSKHGGPGNSCDSGTYGNHIMSYGSLNAMSKWSTCSRSDFQALYWYRKNNWCMEGKTATLLLILCFHHTYVKARKF